MPATSFRGGCFFPPVLKGSGLYRLFIMRGAVFSVSYKIVEKVSPPKIESAPLKIESHIIPTVGEESDCPTFSK